MMLQQNLLNSNWQVNKIFSCNVLLQNILVLRWVIVVQNKIIKNESSVNKKKFSFRIQKKDNLLWAKYKSLKIDKLVKIQKNKRLSIFIKNLLKI